MGGERAWSRAQWVSTEVFFLSEFMEWLLKSSFYMFFIVIGLRVESVK